jgi:hypothetical protein
MTNVFALLLQSLLSAAGACPMKPMGYEAGLAAFVFSSLKVEVASFSAEFASVYRYTVGRVA